MPYVVADVQSNPASLISEKAKNSAMARLAISATEYYLLVDVDGVAPWPHTAGTKIRIIQVAGGALKTAASEKWALQVGIVLRIDGTDADIHFMAGASISLKNTSKFDGASSVISIYPDFIPLEVVGGALKDFAAAAPLVETGVPLTTATLIADAIGTTTVPAVGDLVLRANLLAGSGALDWAYSVRYWVE